MHWTTSPPDHHLLPYVLSHCTFPQLEQFQCELTLTSNLISFLNRHAGLRSIEVSPFENTRLFKEGDLPTIDIPALEYFSGNAQAAAKLGPRVMLRSASVLWNAMDQHPHLAIQRLQPRGNDDHLRNLNCRRRGWNLDLLDLISASLPNILVLNVANVLVVDSRPTKDYLNAIESQLSRFKCLRRLGIHCVDTWQMGSIQCNLDEDFKTVKAWGAACPSLEEIVLPHSAGVTWHRVVDGLWLPDPRNQCGAVWLYESVMSRKYPDWNRVVKFLETRVAFSSALDLPHLQPPLEWLEDLAHASVVSIVISTHPDGEPRQIRWAISPGTTWGLLDTGDAPSSRLGDQEGALAFLNSTLDPGSPDLPVKPPSSSAKVSLRDWKSGRGHRSFMEL
ncbi:hypothetical protein DFP72DRAFT_830366 [Ephemerocybe angulata]|uniref:Uncharacterized protein n=1 Tax=Ephemerocybe angulata TaxID=980116 RepID=A0A8H6HAC8_9AGAR|nr:hypothetical protein DFP72DRAFT_830366 [Tulosesus angulatus]